MYRDQAEWTRRSIMYTAASGKVNMRVCSFTHFVTWRVASDLESDFTALHICHTTPHTHV